MNFISGNTGLMLQRSIDYLWQNQSCILDNIANAETPGYQTKYVTFEESLLKAIQSAEQSGKSATYRTAIQQTPITVERTQVSTRLDDNGVNITDQMVQLAQNGCQIQYVMDAISSDFSLLRTAIRG